METTIFINILRTVVIVQSSITSITVLSQKKRPGNKNTLIWLITNIILMFTALFFSPITKHPGSAIIFCAVMISTFGPLLHITTRSYYQLKNPPHIALFHFVPSMMLLLLFFYVSSQSSPTVASNVATLGYLSILLMALIIQAWYYLGETLLIFRNHTLTNSLTSSLARALPKVISNISRTYFIIILLIGPTWIMIYKGILPMHLSEIIINCGLLIYALIISLFNLWVFAREKNDYDIHVNDI